MQSPRTLPMVRMAAAALGLCAVVTAGLCASGPDGSSEGQLEFSERIVAGGPGDFMEVRHIVMRGTNFEIGRKLGEIARARHNAGPLPYPVPEHNRAQREYFEAHCPILIERMKGVAAAFGLDFNNEGWNFSTLLYGVPITGCSVVFYPPATTESGQGVMSRNFDFTTGTFGGRVPAEGEMPACARPYVIEMHPDEGYASIVICCFDLLTGVMDGVNSEGLAIAILSDNDVISEIGVDAYMGFKAGFNEMQIMRCILDTCTDIEEAKKVLLSAALYYNTAPYHYMVVDRYGRSFVWENAPGMESGHIVGGSDAPLVTTNFLLHRYPDPGNLPEEEERLGWFNRYREIKRRLGRTQGPYDDEFIKETNRAVAAPGGPGQEGYAPLSTMWHALYYPAERRFEADFYLGWDEKSGPRRSGYIEFALGE